MTEVAPVPGMIFVGGLHRSGTTLLAQLLAEHRLAAGLTSTGVSHDEGQHLHTVIPPDSDIGGPGRFAFSPAAHITESSPLDSDAGDRMLASWRPYYDATKPYLIEKSPPNLLRFRLYEKIFSDPYCIAIVRHPIAVAYATEFWTDGSIESLFEHWLYAHELFESDRPHLRRLLLLRYEDVVADPSRAIQEITQFVGIDPYTPNAEVRTDTNRRYFARFRHSRYLPTRLKIAPTVRRFEDRLQALGYGYSFRDIDEAPPNK